MFDLIVAKTEQIEVAGRPERVVKPSREQHRALQDEAIALSGHAQSVEESLKRINA